MRADDQPPVKDSHNDRMTEHLLAEIRQLTEPRTPLQLLRDAGGLFVPGFKALPAVSIVEVRPTGSSRLPEKFTTGQLFSFEVEIGSIGLDKRTLTFFTPVEHVSIPPVRFSPPSLRSRSTLNTEMESPIGWSNLELYFAWLPWDVSMVGGTAELAVLSRTFASMNPLPGRLQASLLVGGVEIPVYPKFGLRSWVPAPSVESIVFPVNYARRLIEPFFFRLRLPPSYRLPDGHTVQLPQSVTLSFRFPEADLARIYTMAGLSTANMVGYSIIGNAIPVTNVDLKAWEPDVAYADFARTTSMKPLGFAGIVPYKQSDDFESYKATLDRQPWSTLSNSAEISLEFNKDGRLTSHYALPNVPGGSEDSQMLFWMTYGEEVNDLMFRYTDTEQIQPMHVTTESLQQATTIVPCFGGHSCRAVDEVDMYESLMLNFAAPPQMLMFKASLLYTVKDFLMKLGYKDRQVCDPSVEMRVIEGARQRVTLVYIKDTPVNPMRKEHVAAIQDYMDQRAPIGSRIMIEIV